MTLTDWLHAVVTLDAPVLAYAIIGAPVAALVAAAVATRHDTDSCDAVHPFGYTCSLDVDHDGQHEDTVTESPAVYVWGEFGAPESLPPVVQRLDVARAIFEASGSNGDTFGVLEDSDDESYSDYAAGASLPYSSIDYVDTRGRANRTRLSGTRIGTDATYSDVAALVSSGAAGVYVVEVPGTVWGDYVGTMTNRANYDTLVERYPDTFVTTTDHYGASSLWLPVVGPLVPAALLDDAVSAAYGAIDDDALDTLERHEGHDVVEHYADDVVSALESRYGADVLESALVQEFGTPDDDDVDSYALVLTLLRDSVLSGSDAYYALVHVHGSVEFSTSALVEAVENVLSLDDADVSS